ncbi:Olfactory receptor 8H3 [Heterocephalus glaber]|uniref:Olfactory receptor 8H3 n=1 Tax=Heterocephalus glaber TaxID=10181 RepID=G5BR54_HETGA|nr:Olfactory receptor 8H3 [Heterocephalus glaber]
MGRWNMTNVPGFILMGLTDSAEKQLVLSMLFLLIYLITVLGNVGMILIIRLDPQLHTPMYFFLTHLSLLDLSYSSVITPKTLHNLLTSTKSISFLGCFTQMYFYIIFVAAECFLLTWMAYDRYVAISSPLHYPVIIRRLFSLLAVSYIIGLLDATVNVLLMSRLPFCKSNIIQHFFCDSTPIVALSCRDTSEVEISIFICAGSNLVLSLITISGSYLSILSIILKINSTAGKKKAFSTCASHLLGVTIFYSTMIFTYLKPKTSYSLGKDQVASVFYTIIPLLVQPAREPCKRALHFWNSNVIHHFFCDLSPILALSYSETHDVEITIFTFGGSTLVLSLITISGSYVSILSIILKINSTGRKQKAFFTCASHGVTFYYGTLIFTDLKLKTSYSLGEDQVASVFYTIVIPMLNPLIYCLRNKEVKNAVV